MRANDPPKDKVFLVLFVQKQSSFHFETPWNGGASNHDRVEAAKTTQKIAGCGCLMARKLL
jgi:hypothetical protein